jgi:hypothetical protein
VSLPENCLPLCFSLLTEGRGGRKNECAASNVFACDASFCNWHDGSTCLNAIFLQPNLTARAVVFIMLEHVPVGHGRCSLFWVTAADSINFNAAASHHKNCTYMRCLQNLPACAGSNNAASSRINEHLHHQRCCRHPCQDPTPHLPCNHEGLSACTSTSWSSTSSKKSFLLHVWNFVGVVSIGSKDLIKTKDCNVRKAKSIFHGQNAS